MRALLHGEEAYELALQQGRHDLASAALDGITNIHFGRGHYGPAMEVTERLVVGAPLAHLFHHRIFLMGLALQLIVAAAGALLLLWLGRAAERVAEALGRPRGPRPAAVRNVPIELRAISPLDPVRDGVGLRGPPGS